MRLLITWMLMLYYAATVRRGPSPDVAGKKDMCI
jgi:hypothetical protein